MGRIRTPTVIQMEAVECGAAALGIVLGYFGREVPLEELRVECGVSRDGSNAFNLIQAAKRYGLNGHGFKTPVEKLSEIQLPAILFWEFNHFVVLEGFGKNEVYLNDPAYGPRSISYEELQQSYAGIALTFEKEVSFQPGGKTASLAQQVKHRLHHSERPLLFLLLTGMSLLLPGLVFPAFLMLFINLFFQNYTLPWNGTFLAAAFSTAFFVFFLTWLQQSILTRLSCKLSIRFASDFLWHLLHLPMNFYTQRNPGEIAYRMSLNETVSDTLTGPLLSSFINILLIVIYAAVMAAYNLPIACLGFAAGILNLACMVWIFRSRSSDYIRLQQEVGKTMGHAIGGIQQIETLKAKGLEGAFFSKWAGYYTNGLNTTQQIGKKDILISILPPFFQLLSLTALLGLGSLRIIEGSMTPGELMALQLLLVNFLTPINKFVWFTSLMQNMKVDLGRLDDVVKNVTVSKQRPNSSSTQKLSGRLEFRQVSFQYAPLSPRVLTDIHFTIEPGQRIAFVGSTGSGKSTIAKLAAGLLTPVSGQILYDGILLNEISADRFRNSIASVDQEIFLFSGTIRENLTFWNPKVHDEMLIDAARDAAIHEEILLRGGYDSLLIEGGRNLSGGQRQRLEIARAFLYHPTLLILDEATSALDSKTEVFVSDKIRQRGCSALMIAHRLSTIQDCDEIIVLDRGVIAERGKHEDLRSAGGIYQTLVESELCLL